MIAHEIIETIPRLMRWIRAEMRMIAKPKLTIAQLRILTKLYQGPKTMGELVEIQGVSAPAVSKMISGLEKQGYVERIAAGKDRRCVTAQLTSSGSSAYKNIQNQVQERIELKLSKMLPMRKRRIFVVLQYLRGFYED